MSRAVSAVDTLGNRQAVLLYPHGMANLNGRFLNAVKRPYGSSGAHARTARTLWAAIAALVRHDWLHQVHQPARGAEYMVGAFRHAELTARAMLLDIPGRKRAWGSQGCLADREGFCLYHSKAAINLFLVLSHRSTREQGRREQEGAPGGV